MLSKSYLLKVALFSALVVISNPMIAQAQKVDNLLDKVDKICVPKKNKPCQAVPAPALLPALMLLGGGMMLYKRRKQSSQVVPEEQSP